MSDTKTAKKLAESTSDLENLRAAAEKVEEAQAALNEANIRISAADVSVLTKEATKAKGSLAELAGDIEEAIVSEADTFEGFACTVTVYPTETNGPRAGDYVVEVAEKQRNHRHEFRVMVDEMDDGPDTITSATIVKCTSLDTGEELDPEGFGASPGVAWNNGMNALLEAGKFTATTTDVRELLRTPEV
jgi:hypothetical protein